MNEQALALKGGGLLIFAMKFVFAIALAGLAIADKNTEFIKKHPGLVVSEAVVVGAGSALAFAIIGLNRNATSSLMKTCILAFAIFFGVHFLLELSGFNEVVEETAGSKKLEALSSKAKKSVVGKIVFTLIALMLIMFTLCGWDTPFPEAAAKWRIKGVPGFMMEGFFFALLGALPFIMIVKDRRGSTKEALTEFAKYFVLFYMGHFGLQYGGLYREAGFMPA